MWNFIFMIVALVASVTITVVSLKAQAAIKQLKSFTSVDEDFIKVQNVRITYLMLTGLWLCGIVIITNFPTFEVKYSMWHGLYVFTSSMVYAVSFPLCINIKMIRA